MRICVEMAQLRHPTADVAIFARIERCAMRPRLIKSLRYQARQDRYAAAHVSYSLSKGMGLAPYWGELPEMHACLLEHRCGLRSQQRTIPDTVGLTSVSMLYPWLYTTSEMPTCVILMLHVKQGHLQYFVSAI